MTQKTEMALSPTSRKHVIIIEGPIGAGKTELTNELGRALGPSTLTLIEPDEKDGANPYLSDYYEDPTRYSFTMQMHLLGKRLRMHLQAQWHALNGYGDAVLDRSFYGDTSFARLQLAMGLMSPREFETYQMLYQAMTTQVLLPTVCIRLLVDPETCNKRVLHRMQEQEGRQCEKGIDLEYLVRLDREIEGMVNVLKAQGVSGYEVPWDVERKDAAAREGAVKGLVSRIRAVTPPDIFLDLHRRTV